MTRKTATQQPEPTGQTDPSPSVADLEAQLAGIRAAEEIRRQQEMDRREAAEMEYIRQRAESYDAAQLDRDAREARAALEQAVRESPVFLALVALNRAEQRRVEHRNANVGDLIALGRPHGSYANANASWMSIEPAVRVAERLGEEQRQAEQAAAAEAKRQLVEVDLTPAEVDRLTSEREAARKRAEAEAEDQAGSIPADQLSAADRERMGLPPASSRNAPPKTPYKLGD